MGNPAISVIIPTFNDAIYLMGCIQSIEAQTLPVFEIVLVDDGSYDESALLEIQKVSKRFDKVRLHRQVNKGPAAARNLGLQEAKGNYIAFVDADDRLRNDSLAQRYEMICRNDMIVGAYSGFEVVGPTQAGRRCSKFKRTAAEMLRANDVGKANGVPGGLPLYLFRVEPLRAIGGLDEALLVMEDFDVILRLAAHGYLFSGTNEPTYLRTLRASSHSRSSSKRKFLGSMKFLSKARRKGYFGVSELCRRYVWAAADYTRGLFR